MCIMQDTDPKGKKMVCRMPALALTDGLYQLLNETESGMIDNTQGPGVAVYLSADGLARADIYIGLKLDGYIYYRNVSSVDPSIKMQFALNPSLLCQSRVLTFRSYADSTINIQVLA